MKVEFTQYLHNEWEEGLPWSLQQKLGDMGLSSQDMDDLAEKAGRPFYEVGIRCTIDTETGHVEMLGVRST